MNKTGPIGVFDSGYGGLTVFRELTEQLPQYDYLYLGDNARTPYGNRSFETVYHYTLECIKHLFDKGCRLIIIACNTSSAKALRTIQQNDLPKMDPSLRVLGVIRPTTEIVGKYTKSGQVGILATTGTVVSESYPIEIEKFYPEIQVFQEACPMWVPLVENDEYHSEGADFFVKKYLNEIFNQSRDIDTLILGCTHYPLLVDKIKKYLPEGVTLLSQGPIVAHSLIDYFQRHPEMEAQCSKGGTRKFLTTDDPETFNRMAAIFYGNAVESEHLAL